MRLHHRRAGLPMEFDARPRTFVADAKFGDVIACLVARGWRRVALDRRDAALSWRNLAKTDFGRLAPGAIVNHFSGSQAVSHKATLAAALADRGADYYPACYDLRLPAHARRSPRRARAGASSQKYAERPLLFHGRKFDVRQWVLVTSLAPLVVWGFSDCYARFASAPWDLGGPGLGDRFAHLCNHSVQRDAPAGGPVPEHMWAARDLAAAVDGRFGAGAFAGRLAPRLGPSRSPSAASSLRRARVGRGFEWLGLDLMVADDLSCWLLEANVSPDVSRSTAVTAALVPAAADCLRLVLDEGHGDDAGAAVDLARAAGAARAAPADRRSQALTWDERETVAGVVRLQAKEWQAAGLMSLTLPDGLHDKVSLLDAFSRPDLGARLGGTPR
ncbi:hypothetical protein JL722_690 [Aureococcus anophagefferens]|nr:hypothetical protein JL722_690 [Aureococcus anophagefferens]